MEVRIFKDFSIFIKDDDELARYKCSKCNYILCDAVQSGCGHWLCQHCANEELFRNKEPKCHAWNTRLVEFFPGKFIRREIRSLAVTCIHEGCRWQLWTIVWSFRLM